MPRGSAGLGHTHNVLVEQFLEKTQDIHLLRNWVNPQTLFSTALVPGVNSIVSMIRVVMTTNASTSVYHTHFGRCLKSYIQTFAVFNLATLEPDVIKIGPITFKPKTKNVLQLTDDVLARYFVNFYLELIGGYIRSRDNTEKDSQDQAAYDYFKTTNLYKMYAYCRGGDCQQETQEIFKDLFARVLDVAKARLTLALFDSKRGQPLRTWVAKTIRKEFSKEDIKRATETNNLDLLESDYGYDGLFSLQLLENICDEAMSSLTARSVALSSGLIEANLLLGALKPEAPVSVFGAHPKT